MRQAVDAGAAADTHPFSVRCSGLFQKVPGIPALFEFGVLQLSGSSVAQVPGAATVCWLETVSGGPGLCVEAGCCTLTAPPAVRCGLVVSQHVHAGTAAVSPFQ